MDADVEIEEDATARALKIAGENHAALVSFSPEQITEKWYEKALIPFVYCRLARRFSYAAVNDPKSAAAAANGQFLLIRRDVYEAVGGHARFASDVLEDVALGTAVKAAGHRLWFGPGKGIVARANVPHLWRDVGRMDEKSLSLDGRNAVEGVSRRRIGVSLDTASGNFAGNQVSGRDVRRSPAVGVAPDELRDGAGS